MIKIVEIVAGIGFYIIRSYIDGDDSPLINWFCLSNKATQKINNNIIGVNTLSAASDN